jgi:hypothetical protein
MTAVDLKDAYFHVPLHPHHQKCFQFECRGKPLDLDYSSCEIRQRKIPPNFCSDVISGCALLEAPVTTASILAPWWHWFHILPLPDTQVRGWTREMPDELGSGGSSIWRNVIHVLNFIWNFLERMLDLVNATQFHFEFPSRIFDLVKADYNQISPSDDISERNGHVQC